MKSSKEINQHSSVSIIGLGRLGNTLGSLLSPFYQINGTTRDQKKLKDLARRYSYVQLLIPPHVPSGPLLDCDSMILNIPPFPGQLEWFRSWNIHPKTHLIFISSISVYGPQQGVIDENSPLNPQSENAQILYQEEQWAQSFPRSSIIRLGGLIGPHHHPGQSLSGKKNLSHGNDPVNLVHLEDAAYFIKLVLENQIVNEVFNLVCPQHPTRKDYYTHYAQANGLPLPEFIQGPGEGKIVSSQKVSALYQFRHQL